MLASREQVAEVKEAFKVGDRVRMEYMDDPYVSIPFGVMGTVRHVDDAGTVHVDWDNGLTLGACVLHGDEIRNEGY
jgi:hypothetical protein